MTLGEFIKIKKELEEAKYNYTITKKQSPDTPGKYVCHIEHNVFLNENIDVVIEDGTPLYREFQELSALNKLSSVFEQHSIIEYVLTKEFIDKLTPVRSYNAKPFYDSYEEKYQMKLEKLGEYLGSDYEIPRALFQNQIMLSKINLVDAFNLDGEVAQQIILETNKVLAKAVSEKDMNLTRKEPILVARLMGKEEYQKFITGNIVSGTTFDDSNRIWCDDNEVGVSGDYTFMILDNTENTLKNITSVIPYLEENSFSEETKDKYLVFFRAKNIPENACFEGPYYEKFEKFKVSGTHKSYEASVPYYSKSNFEIISSSPVCKYNIVSKTVETLEEIGLLNLPELDNTNLSIFDKIQKYTTPYIRHDADTKDKQFNEYCKSLPPAVRVDLIQGLFDAQHVGIFKNAIERYYNENSTSCDATLIESLDDAFKFALLAQEKYGLSRSAVYQIAGNLVQYNNEWCLDNLEQNHNNFEIDKTDNNGSDLGEFAEYYDDEYYNSFDR